MSISSNHSGSIALALWLVLGQAGCNSRTPGADDAAPAPVDSGVQTGTGDTAAAPATDPVPPQQPETSVATPPITPPPPETRPDTPPAGAAKPSQPGNQAKQGGSLKVTPVEYEGWRQYSVNCARCHGQDVLPNPVAANLLVSAGPGGPMEDPKTFFQVVSEGRPERGMPGFKALLTPEQIDAVYAYVKGRAEGRIPPGRPERPQA